jgi:ATP-binding cassette, subfamily C (CFTR/MRP), member 1
MRKGAVDYITETDLPPLLTKDKSVNLGHDLQAAMKKQCDPSFSSLPPILTLLIHSVLWKALFVAYGTPYAIAAGLKVIQDCLAFLQPQLLRWLLAYISKYQGSRYSPDDMRPSKFEGFSIAGIMFIASVIQTVSLNQVRSA